MQIMSALVLSNPNLVLKTKEFKVSTDNKIFQTSDYSRKSVNVFRTSISLYQNHRYGVGFLFPSVVITHMPFQMGVSAVDEIKHILRKAVLQLF